jgi:hypothetical protein
MSNPFVARHRIRRRRRGNRHYSRRRRGNPSLRSFASGNMLHMIGGGAAGFFGSRFIPQNVPFLAPYNVGFAGYGLDLLSGLGISWALGKFWSKQAGVGAMVGTGLAVLSRIIVEKMAPATPSGATAMAGDLDFDLGYYISDRFPYPQGTAGPFDAYPGTPYLSNPPFPSTSAAAVRAGAAAAATANQLSLPSGSIVGAPASIPGAPQADRWSSVWT